MDRKEYQKQYQKVYRELNKEKAKEYQKIYRQENPDKLEKYKERQKERYVKKVPPPRLTPEERRERQKMSVKKYYYANREKILSYCNTKITCCCGATITRKFKTLHMTTPKHERKLKQLYLNELSYYNF